MQEISQKIAKAVKELFDVDITPVVSFPDPEFGDFSTNIAMQLAGRLQKNPREIAEKIAVALEKQGLGSSLTSEYSTSDIKSQEQTTTLSASVAGAGFLNISVSGKFLKQTLDHDWNEKYGENNDGAGKTVIVEYPSQNMAKPYSVGHLRPGTQGHAAKKLMEATGWKVITDNHLGDYGTPFGVWATGFYKLSSEAKLAERGVYELGDMYIQMKKLLKEEAEADAGTPLADEVQEWLLKLEQGDTLAAELSKRFSEISLRHIHEVMGRLGISTDYELGELFFAPMGKKLVDEYLTKGIFKKNADGSVICELDEFGIDVPLLVLKSNGAALYATTDLATMSYRETEFKPDRIIHAVGAEQKFYFEQLFAMAKKLGLKAEMVHLYFGTIDQKTEDGKREKMSSRKGVVLMEELLDKAEEKAREIIKNRGDEATISENDIRKIALGAVKLSDFTADRKTGILFDWETIFALTGFSGPYIQYAGVRMNKILQSNADFAAVSFEDYDFEAEKPLLKLLLTYPSVIRESAEKLEMHKIAYFAYNLASEFNKYYEKSNVNNATNDIKSARLEVLKQVSQTLTHAFDMLGIEVPEKM